MDVRRSRLTESNSRANGRRSRVLVAAMVLAALGEAVGVPVALSSPGVQGGTPLGAAIRGLVGERGAPSAVRQVAGPGAILVASLSRPEGVWQVWESATKAGVYDYLLEPGRSPQNVTGGQCPALRRKSLISVCLWGSVDERYDASIGRLGPRGASLEARTARGEALVVTRGRRGIYLVVSSRRAPAKVLIVRDARGKVIARRPVGLPSAEELART